MDDGADFTMLCFYPFAAHFWYEIYVYGLLWRLHFACEVATNERFARESFKAYSATARLQKVALLLSAEGLIV